MFGLFGSSETELRDAAKGIISSEFKDGSGRPYVISPTSEPVFRGITKDIKSQGGNAYDVAVAMMLAAINSLYNPSGEIEAWANDVAKKCDLLMTHGVIGRRVILQQTQADKIAEVSSPRAPRPHHEKKAAPEGNNLDEIAGSVTRLLQVQTSLARSGVNFSKRIDDLYSRGYVFGACEGRLQISRITDTDSMTKVLGMIYISLHGKNSDGAFVMVMNSMVNQNDPQFSAGRALGGQEMIEFFRDEKPPLGLADYLME